MLKLINLQKLTANSLIGVLLAGGLIVESSNNKGLAVAGCDNNGHGNNAPMTVSLSSGNLTIGHFDPSKSNNNQRNKLIADLDAGNFGNNIHRNAVYYINFTGTSYTLSTTEATDIVNSLPDWEMTGNGTTTIYECSNDYDNDGISDAIELGSNFNSPPDTDTDGVPDFQDNTKAVDDSATTPINQGITFSVLNNDLTTDGDSLTIDSFTPPSNGTVIKNSDNTFTYTPNQNYSGPDIFTYTISDVNNNLDVNDDKDTARVTVTVQPNNFPAAVNDSETTNQNQSLTINVLGNDSDPDNHTLTIGSFTQPSNGTVTNNNDGTFTYTPNQDYIGQDTFTYTISDGNGGTGTAMATVTVEELAPLITTLAPSNSCLDWSAVLTANPSAWVNDSAEGNHNDLYEIYYHQGEAEDLTDDLYIRVKVNQKWNWPADPNAAYQYTPSIVNYSRWGTGGFTTATDLLGLALHKDNANGSNGITLEFFKDGALTEKADVKLINFTLTDMDSGSDVIEQIVVNAQNSSGEEVDVRFDLTTNTQITADLIDDAQNIVTGYDGNITGSQGNVAPTVMGNAHKVSLTLRNKPGSAGIPGSTRKRYSYMSDPCWNFEASSITEDEPVTLPFTD
ncbi:MAG: cadherin-like domain-containing protein [Xenococcaceae cyanobacterium MO_234.B1]|nr:cadherin-like domain-containing protein [Xenococcaceae cyanobacterium MO_234.B1]